MAATRRSSRPASHQRAQTVRNVTIVPAGLLAGMPFGTTVRTFSGQQRPADDVAKSCATAGFETTFEVAWDPNVDGYVVAATNVTEHRIEFE